MKRAIAFLMALTLVAAALSGCGAKDDPQTTSSPAPDQATGVFTPLDPNDDNLDDSLTAAPTVSPSASINPPIPPVTPWKTA